MPTTPYASFSSPWVALPAENVDTDQIIPARFLKTTERSGLGSLAFHDWRYRPDGTPNPDFVLNREGAAEAKVLVAGRNFGCGSSREHAVWALLGAGFRAVVSSEFADIFRGNALGNGLLPIQVDARTAARLLTGAGAGEDAGESRTLSVDLAAQTLTLPDGETVRFPVAPFAKHCLLHGIDEMDFLLGAEAEVAAYEAGHPAGISTVSGGILA